MNSSIGCRTYVLLVGAFLIVVVEYFYAPWEKSTLKILELFTQTGLVFSIKLMLVKIFFPLLSTYVEATLFISHYIKINSDFSITTMAIVCTAFWSYIFASIITEKYHDLLVEDGKNSLQSYIETLCLENILMYFANLFVYEIVKKMEEIKSDRAIIIMLITIIYVITMWTLLFFIIYLMIWLLVLITPTILIAVLPLNNIIMHILIFIALILLQVLWEKYFSIYFLDKLYNLLTLKGVRVQ